MKVDKTLKAELVRHCSGIILEKINESRSELLALQQSSEGESKSSAGDKYETSREMIQQERDKIVSNLSISEQQLRLLSTVDPQKQQEAIGFGSLICTNQGFFLIAVPIGVVTCKGVQCFVVSTSSPLGRSFLNKSKGEKVVLIVKPILSRNAFDEKYL